MSYLFDRIQFISSSQAVEDALPRMDIAAFVGFASYGPVGVPIAIEDAEQFQKVFGPDVPLLWDVEKGYIQKAYLGETIRAFFRNGGQRCWVVRVASQSDENKLPVQWFPVPGVTGVTYSKENFITPMPSYMVARSPGSWADAVTITTHLDRESFGAATSPIAEIKTEEGLSEYNITIPKYANQPIQPGDLLQLRFTPRDTSFTPELLGFFPIRTQPEDAPDKHISVRGRPFVCTRICSNPYPPSHICIQDKTNPGNPDGCWISLEDITIYQSPQLSSSIQLQYKNPENAALPQNGVIWPIRWLDSGSPPIYHYGFIIIKNSITSINGNDTDVILEINEDDIWELIDPAIIEKEYFPEPIVERVSFSITSDHPISGKATLDNIGFISENLRSWLNLKPDSKMFYLPDEPAMEKRKVDDFHTEVIQKSFQLAAPDVIENNSDPFFWLPIGMDESFINTTSLHAAGDTSPETALQRDGLVPANKMDELFLDDNLVQVSTNALETQAVYHRFVSDKKNAALRGIHSLFFIDEITLLSAPDAVHLGWQHSASYSEDDILYPYIPPPELTRDQNETKPKSIALKWRLSMDTVSIFILQHAIDPRFLNIISSYDVKNKTVEIPLTDGCIRHHYFRVRALCGSRTSPWSNTVDYKIESDFLETGYIDLIAPKFSIQEIEGTRFSLLSWDEQNTDVTYQIEKSADPLFGYSCIEQVQANPYQVSAHPVQRRYYRVRSVRDRIKSSSSDSRNNQSLIYSPWSNTLPVIPQYQKKWRYNTATEFKDDALLNIHIAMIKMARARGDIVCILSVPGYFQSENVMEYKNRLISKTTDDDDQKALSYAAVYHPWTISAHHDKHPVAIPPDGAVCGAIAQKSLRFGAWVAPANIILRDVKGLNHNFQMDEIFRILEAQINLLSRDTRGFAILNAVTLSTDDQLTLLNVRRLLILLRRLALRRGNDVIFRTNDDSTRRAIERNLEGTLTSLFSRGAFAGDTPEKAFRVIADKSNNFNQSIDQGRLIVDLKVAPSQPLEFITIRLIMGQEEIDRALEI